MKLFEHVICLVISSVVFLDVCMFWFTGLSRVTTQMLRLGGERVCTSLKGCVKGCLGLSMGRMSEVPNEKRSIEKAKNDRGRNTYCKLF